MKTNTVYIICIAPLVACTSPSPSSVVTGTSTTPSDFCSCNTGGATAVCSGTTTFTATQQWTSTSTELLAGCQTSGEAGFYPTYTCVFALCGQPCGTQSICGAPAPEGGVTGSSIGTATGTSTGP
jgi:hypothetical protein